MSDLPAAEAAHVRPPASQNLPQVGLVQFGIPLGIAGLAGAWTAAEGALGATEWVADSLWLLAAVFWLAIGVVYVVPRATALHKFSADLKHPIFGPFAAYFPLIGVLLMTHFGQYISAVAPFVVWLLVAASLVVAAQLFAHWLTGELSIDYLHPGYFLPVVAAAFVASIGLSSVGSRDGAIAAFGAGLFFWLVIGTIVTNRLITRGSLPEGVRPTLAVLVVPPAVGGIAWLFLNGGHADPVGYGFLGTLIVLLVVQIFLLPTYTALAPSVSFWTFSFPLASAANFSIRWMAASPFPGSEVVSWIVLGVGTVAIVVIAISASFVPVVRSRRARTSAAGQA